MLNEERSPTSYFQINMKESFEVVEKHHFKLPNIKSNLKIQLRFYVPIKIVGKNKINYLFKIN